MSREQPMVGKPKLSKQILEQHGIYFDEHIHTSDELPRWIRSMPRHLLRFRGRLPYIEREKFLIEHDRFRESGQDREEALRARWSLTPPNLDTDSIYIKRALFGENKATEAIQAELKSCSKIREDVIMRRGDKEEEFSWMDLLVETVFQRFDKVYPTANTYEKRHYAWARHRDLAWNECSNRENSNPKVIQRTGPRPDLTYAFPIIDTSKAPESDDQFDSRVEAFSLRVLSHLRNSNRARLRSAPTTPLQHYNEKKPNSQLGAEHLICFPWAIVEAKRSESKKWSERFCYYQAANAAAEALILREELARKAKDFSKTHDALMIFAFTCVGPSAKLWITYREEDSQNIVMRCIWATSLELTWGVLMLRMVVKNMREWVYERVKGEIANWILKIHHDLLLPTVLSPDGDVVEQRRRAASCEAAPRVPTTPDYSTTRLLPSRGKTAPGSVGRRNNMYSSPSSSPRVRREFGNFIDDPEGEDVWDDRADEGYISHVRSEDEGGGCSTESESESEGADDDEEDDDDEVKGLADRTKAWWPDSSRGQQDDDNDDVYFIDGERITIRLSKARKSLAVDSLRKKDRAVY